MLRFLGNKTKGRSAKKEQDLKQQQKP